MHKWIILGFVIGVASSFVAQAIFEDNKNGQTLINKAKTLKASVLSLKSDKN